MADELSLDDILKEPPTKAELDEFFSGRDPAWHRFARGAYSAPHSWWITWVHLSMLSGAWGSQYQGAAQINQKSLNLVLEEALMLPNKKEIFTQLGRVKFGYQKAHSLGRFAANYYITGKASKNALRKWPMLANIVAPLGNFGVTAFGSGILATANGYNSVEDVILAMLTGEVKRYPNITNRKHTGGHQEDLGDQTTAQFIEKFIEIMEEANDFDPSSALSYDEWCKKNPDMVNKVSFCQ